MADLLNTTAVSLTLDEARVSEVTKVAAVAISVIERFRRMANAVIHDMFVTSGLLTQAQFEEAAANIAPTGYEAFQELIPGDYEYAEALVGIQVTAPTTDQRAGIGSLTLNVDVPDVVQRGYLVISDASDHVITFDTSFHAVPEVHVTVVQGVTASIPYVTNITTTGFTLSLRSATAPGTKTNGDAAWQAIGY